MLCCVVCCVVLGLYRLPLTTKTQKATVLDVIKDQELVYFPDYLGISACSEILAQKHIRYNLLYVVLCCV